MLADLRTLWSSAGFRLACYVGLLVAMTLAAALSIVYLQTVGVMQQRMARALALEAARLESPYQEGGLDAVALAVQDALTDGSNVGDELIFLISPDGIALIGNVDPTPERLSQGLSQRSVVRNGQRVTAQLLTRPLPDGSLLVVGRDLFEQSAIESLVIQASMAAMVVATLLLIGGTFVFRQVLEQSVGAIRTTAARIAAGNLQERVALSGQGDEFDLLNRDINHMLDRIQSLMDGVRHVSDTIAHNLRTPLTRVLLRLNHAAAAQPPMGSLDLQAAIQASIHDLEELTIAFEKLLQIAEAEAGTRRMPFSQVALGPIAADVYEMYDAVAEAQGSTLTYEAREEVFVVGDADLLAGVLANLVDNALKYAGHGSTVAVKVQRQPEHAVLTVKDNGPGIDAAEWHRIGTRFHRLDPSQPGHGLGLASVRAVVGLHGGKLQFEDTGPGLAVHVVLPLLAQR